MSKIVQAVNTMIANPQLIGRVLPGAGNSDELFFVYKEKYKWSLIRFNDNEIRLVYYPGIQTLEELANYSDEDWRFFSEMVSYSSQEIGTREAQASFSELHTTLKERVYGVNKVLDDIIDDLF